MSVVKNKNNTETKTKTTIKNKQLKPHITENVGLIEQQKIQKTTQTTRYREHRSDWATIICDDPWPIHFSAKRASQKAHITKKLL